MKVGIIGFGSIGERHAQNAQRLGHEIHVFRTGNSSKFTKTSSEDFEFHFELEAFLSLPLECMIICNPTHLHAEFITYSIARSIPFFVEKPIASTLKEAAIISEALAKSPISNCAGYMMRYDESIIKIKELLTSGVIGTVTTGIAHWSSYLPDWHPWEDYSTGYAAQKEMGGGLALTCSHEIDTLRFLFGEPSAVSANSNSVQTLKTNTDDYLDALITFKQGISILLHIDWFQKTPQRTLSFLGDEGRLDWDFFTREIKLSNHVTDTHTKYAFKADNNIMYQHILEDFLSSIQNKHSCKSEFEDARKTLEVCFQMLEGTNL